MKVLDQLVDAHEFKIPQVMIDDEIRQMLQRLVPKLAESAEDFPVDSFRGDFEETATRRRKAGVIVDRVATAEDFKAEQSDIENWVQEMAQGDPAATSQIEKQLRESKDARAHVEEEIRRNKVLELLTSRTEIVYVADDGSDEDVEEATGKKSKPKAKSKEEGQS